MEELEKGWITIYNDDDFVGTSYVIKYAGQTLSKCHQSIKGIGWDDYCDSNLAKVKL
jgi:hypothetical protein